MSNESIKHISRLFVNMAERHNQRAYDTYQSIVGNYVWRGESREMKTPKIKIRYYKVVEISEWIPMTELAYHMEDLDG